ncbi:MAG TPA: response regulator transcription factor [Terriglobales bacterium]|nr:response regulator transcription factor [Terriglobales bacterium]
MQSSGSSREGRIRVLVADSTRMHAQLLADAIQRDTELQVIASVSDSCDLLASADFYEFDVALISSNLDEQSGRGFQVLRELRARRPSLRVVMLLDSTRREDTLQAFHGGARGIFSRYEPVELLCKCIRSVCNGEIWANNQQMAYMVESLASTPAVHAVDSNGMNLLSKRELEVVRSLAEGLTNREIAERLGLSQHTIKNYLFRVFDKLGVSSRVELLYMTLTQAASFPEMPSDSHEAGNGHIRPTFSTGRQPAASTLSRIDLGVRHG